MSYDDHGIPGHNARASYGATSGTEARAPTVEEARFMAMSAEERREHIERMEWASKKAEHDAREARIKAEVERATEVSLANNAWLQSHQRGTLSQRAEVRDGRMTVETINPAFDLSKGTIGAPQALIDGLGLKIGGVSLGAKEAQAMVLRGEIRAQDYQAAVNEALVPYGYAKAKRSFR